MMVVYYRNVMRLNSDPEGIANEKIFLRIIFILEYLQSLANCITFLQERISWISNILNMLFIEIENDADYIILSGIKKTVIKSLHTGYNSRDYIENAMKKINKTLSPKLKEKLKCIREMTIKHEYNICAATARMLTTIKTLLHHKIIEYLNYNGEHMLAELFRNGATPKKIIHLLLHGMPATAV